MTEREPKLDREQEDRFDRTFPRDGLSNEAFNVANKGGTIEEIVEAKRNAFKSFLASELGEANKEK